MLLQKGRPETNDGRLEKEIKVYDLLDSLGIEFERIDTDEPATTMEICEEIDKTLGATTCKNLFLCNRQQTDFYLLLMPGKKPFKTKDISAQIGTSRLSFATAEHMEEHLGVSPGSVCIFGLMNDKENKVRLLIDEDVLKSEFLGTHPCINTTSLKIKTDDVTEKLIPCLKHPVSYVNLPSYAE